MMIRYEREEPKKREYSIPNLVLPNLLFCTKKLTQLAFS